jgi:hypothetical protein
MNKSFIGNKNSDINTINNRKFIQATRAGRIGRIRQIGRFLGFLGIRRIG